MVPEALYTVENPLLHLLQCQGHQLGGRVERQTWNRGILIAKDGPLIFFPYDVLSKVQTTPKTYYSENNLKSRQDVDFDGGSMGHYLAQLFLSWC